MRYSCFRIRKNGAINFELGAEDERVDLKMCTNNFEVMFDGRQVLRNQKRVSGELLVLTNQYS